MNFVIFKLDTKTFPFQKNLISKGWKLFSKKDEEISIFNIAKISNDSYHIVFHISDEYISSTRKGGNESILPFSQYINAFLNKKFLFIENINKNYLNLIKEFIYKEYNVNSSFFTFNNHIILSIVNITNGLIKKLEYIDQDEEDFEAENINIEELNEIINDGNKIDYINYLSNNTFISIQRNSKISINSDNEERLLELIETISNTVY